jgi:hypothetical protein
MLITSPLPLKPADSLSVSDFSSNLTGVEVINFYASLSFCGDPKFIFYVLGELSLVGSKFSFLSTVMILLKMFSLLIEVILESLFLMSYSVGMA